MTPCGGDSDLQENQGKSWGDVITRPPRMNGQKAKSLGSGTSDIPKQNDQGEGLEGQLCCGQAHHH